MSNVQDQTGLKAEVPTRAGYDLWAEHYDSDGNPLIHLEQPEIDRHVGDVKGLRLADIGCGTGRHAVRMAAAGAEVTALDFSEGMLAQAKRKPGAERVRWIAHDLAKPLPLPSAAFDRVLCALVLDHVADLQGLFAEAARICRPAPHGRIVMSVMHPAMLLRGVQARFLDTATGERTPLESVPNQVSDYLMAACGKGGAGLSLVHISEHAPDAACARCVPRAERYIGWPMLLMMVFEHAQRGGLNPREHTEH